MNNNTTIAKNIEALTVAHIRLIAAVATIVLTILAIVTDDVINPDGVLYIQVADTFLSQGFNASMQVYDWPFYAIIAALISKLSHLSLEYSYYVLNTLLFLVLTDALIGIAKEQLQNSYKLAIASIIFLSFYTLNEYRDFIIRDIGYWAASMMAILHMIRFSKAASLQAVLKWQLWLILACLFRIEAIALFMLSPLFFIVYNFNKNNQVIKLISLSYSWLVLLTAIFLAVNLFNIEIFFEQTKMSELTKYLNCNEQLSQLIQLGQLLDLHLVAEISSDENYGLLIALSGFFSITVYEVLTATSVPLVLMALMAYKQKQTSPKSPENVLLSFILFTQLTILFVFILNQQFLSTRYCMLAALILVIILLPKLTSFIELSFNSDKLYKKSLIVLLLIYGPADAFHHKSSKDYLIKASSEISMAIPDNAKILTNDRLLLFYLTRKPSSYSVEYVASLNSAIDYSHLVLNKRKLSKEDKIVLKKNDWVLIEPFGPNKNKIIFLKKPLSTH